MRLSGDTGARNILQRHRDEVYLVDIPDHEAPDIDTPADIVKLRESIEAGGKQ
jgi:CTP:molybdopterin cytidylyltransferase MocA